MSAYFRRLRVIACGTWLLLGVGALPVVGATQEATEKAPAEILEASETHGALDEAIAAVTKNFLNENLGAFFRDWHIEPKVLHAKDSETDSVLGFSYSFHRAVKDRVSREATNRPVGLSLTFDADGTVAANAKKNPNDQLETGVTLHAFQGIGGLEPLMTTLAMKEFQEGATGPEKHEILTKGPAYYRYAERVARKLVPQVFWDLQAHGTMESDQLFKRRQWVYGASLSIAAREWRENAPLGWANIPDYPFAALRWFLDHDTFVPSGWRFPVFILGVDQVDPKEDEARIKLDPGLDKYTRLRAQVVFKTPYAHYNKNPLFVSATYRYFRETGATDIIKNAKLDRSNYFEAKLGLPSKFFLSYASGRLPFDHKNDQVYAIGWALIDPGSEGKKN
jgi:hypothetical protein